VAPGQDTGRAVSPELVLVDPELATRARAALPDHPWPAPVRIEPRPRPAEPGGAPVGLKFWMFILGVIVLVGALTLVSTRDRPTLAAEVEGNEGRVPATSTSSVAQPKPKPGAAKPKPRAARPKSTQRSGENRARSSPPPSGRPRTQTPARPRAQTPAPPTRRTVPRRAVRQGFRPARIFSWPPRAGASYYQVVFLRNSKPFYRTRTTAARLRLPERVRFTAGIYRWTVRPAIASDAGIVLALPVVDSTFRVDAD
jgi:hypothetical protein